MVEPLLYPRLLVARINEALSDTPVTLIVGPRQAGKTTLVRQLASRDMQYLTLDDELTRLAATEDPEGMIRSLDRAIIDEVQRAPQLLLAIKKSVDQDRRPGRFLLTGSANLMMLPTVADSLAGRMETLTLLPLSQSEIQHQDTNWIDAAFAGQLAQASDAKTGNELVETVLAGGYPDALMRTTSRRRIVWSRQYIDALIQRDVRDVAAIDKLDHLPRFLRSLAHTSGQLCNYSRLGSQVGLDGKTTAKYAGVFEQMFMLRRVEAWAKNRMKRVVKTPKLQFIDSGLLATLANVSADDVKKDRSSLGPLLESFVYGELLKHTTTTDKRYELLYHRDHDNREVDFVIENAGGELLAVEVKASATVKQDDLSGLRTLARVAGKQFRMGVLLYDGTDTLPVGEGLWAVPVSSLWGSC